MCSSDLPNLATIDLRGSRGSLRRVVEVKTARDLGEFGDDGSGEIPRDYAAQILMQMLITGWHETADLVCWAQYGKPRIYHVEYDAGIADAVVAHCVRFVKSLATGKKPALDNTVSTYETVKALHPDIDGTTVEVPPDLAAAVLDNNRDAKFIAAHLQECKTRLLDLMGNAQVAEVAGIKVADRRPHGRGGVALALCQKNYNDVMEHHDNTRERTA